MPYQNHQSVCVYSTYIRTQHKQQVGSTYREVWNTAGIKIARCRKEGTFPHKIACDANSSFTKGLLVLINDCVPPDPLLKKPDHHHSGVCQELVSKLTHVITLHTYCIYCIYCIHCMYCMYCIYCTYCMYINVLSYTKQGTHVHTNIRTCIHDVWILHSCSTFLAHFARVFIRHEYVPGS